MSEHSPGPWKWTESFKGGTKNVLVDGRGVTVAHTYTCVADWDTSDADRRLVAAAPELLAMLKVFHGTPCASACDACALIKRIDT